LRQGLTLIELLLALVMVCMISAAVASMLAVFSAGSRDGDGVRRRAAAGEVLIHRLSATLRSAAMVLASDGTSVVLWVSDSRDNDLPDLSEICRIEWGASTHELQRYTAPAGLAEADDAVFQLTDDFLAVTEGLRGSQQFPGEVWAREVSDWQIELDAAPQSARIVQCELTLSDGDAGPAGTPVECTAALRGRINGS
jgi:prepilin-type N-terminal cleavage/methylation domain-containing protein